LRTRCTSLLGVFTVGVRGLFHGSSDGRTDR
jgi:hypothetical protein